MNVDRLKLPKKRARDRARRDGDAAERVTTLATAMKEGYTPARVLPTGETAGVRDMLYTVGLCVGIDAGGWRTRFCYETRAQAEAALAAWNGKGDPPGPWLQEKPSDRLGPGLAKMTLATAMLIFDLYQH